MTLLPEEKPPTLGFHGCVSTRSNHSIVFILCLKVTTGAAARRWCQGRFQSTLNCGSQQKGFTKWNKRKRSKNSLHLTHNSKNLRFQNRNGILFQDLSPTSLKTMMRKAPSTFNQVHGARWVSRVEDNYHLSCVPRICHLSARCSQNLLTSIHHKLRMMWNDYDKRMTINHHLFPPNQHLNIQIYFSSWWLFLGGGIAWHFTDVQSTSSNCCKSLPSGWGPQTHLDRWRILRRFFCNLRVRFFFHFQRNLERAWRHWMSFQQRGHSSLEWRLKLKHLKFWKK